MTNELRDFRLGGAELPAAQKARLKAVEEELAELAAQFDDNLLDATNAWALYVTDRTELAGIPDSVIDEARAAAEADGKPGWKLTLHMPCYLPALSYADNRALRATLHRAYATRASDLGPPPRGTTARPSGASSQLRREAAQLLGYPNFAAALARAQDGEERRRRARRSCAISRAAPSPTPTRDYAELQAFAAAELGIADLAPWDRAYASEKLKARKFAFSEQEVRRYFPEGKVLAGLFRVAETLYGISIRASEAATGMRTSGSSTCSTPPAR